MKQAQAINYGGFYHPASKQTGQNKSWLVFLVALVLAASAGFFYVDAAFQSPVAQAYEAPLQPVQPQPEKAAVAAAQPSAIDTVTMGQQINSALANYPQLETGVSVIDLKTGQSFGYGNQDTYVSASVSKLLTAALYLGEVEAGRKSLDTIVGGVTAAAAIKQMVEQSNNPAWEALNLSLGYNGLQSYAADLGLASFSANYNLLNTGDTASFLARLYNGQLLGQASTQQLLVHMKHANQTQYIADNVPSNVAVYHKAGNLENLAHDAAIIDDGKNPYVLVIFTKSAGKYSYSQTVQLFQQITQATTTAFIK